MPHGPKVFLPDEPLYRVLGPELWDSVNYLIYPPAFLDEGKGYARLSVYLGSKASPRDALRQYAKLGGIRTTYHNPTPEDLWNLSFGVGRFTYAQLLSLKLDFEKNSGGCCELQV